MYGAFFFTDRIKLIPWLALLIAASLSVPRTGLAASQEEIQLPWSQIESHVHGQKVGLVLPDGVRIEGKVLSVDADALILDVKSSSEPRAQRKGASSIPRSAVSVLQLKQIKGNSRWIGAAIGAGGGGVGGWLLAEGVFHVSGEGLQSAPTVVTSVAGLVAGATAIGYFVGRQRDQHVTFIKIIPESNP